MRRAYLTDFHGSAGTAVVTKDKAYLWTDSRYVLLLFLGMCVLGWKTTHDSVSVYNEAYSSSHIAAIFPFHMQVFQRGIHPSRLGSLGPNETGPTKGTHHQQIPLRTGIIPLQNKLQAPQGGHGCLRPIG